MALAAGAVSAQSMESVDLDMVARIRQEAFNHSQVMQTLRELTEDVGPRLTASPNMDKANAWAREKLSGWGMSNVHDEAFDNFGRGWDYSHSRVEMVSPHAVSLYAIPKAWTPGTNGPVEGDAMIVKIQSKADLEKYRGKLKGKIAFVSDAREFKPGTTPAWVRLDNDGLAALHDFRIPADRGAAGGDMADRMARFRERMELVPTINKFLVDEGVLASVSISNRDNGIIGVAGGGSRMAGDPVGVPEVAMVSEQYNQIMRDLKIGHPVRLRIDVDSHFTTEENRPGYNTIAEIPGTGPKASEIVMLGAHMDSWHSATGASDNGAGVAVMMEAMRILKAVGAKPNRTVRVALWSGEEQGLIGSADYVAKHFAAYPPPKDPEQAKLPSYFRGGPQGELQFKPEYNRLSVYFNLDNGSGKIRGVYAQENMASMPIFESWIKPFNDVGATDVVSGNTGSTDHISFDRVGLPGFQFVQDGLDYFSSVHHTNMDTYDHSSPDDLKQAAAIVASMVYNASMQPQRFPRKPMTKN